MRIGKTSSCEASRQFAFTRIDLIVTVLTLAFLALMILPALARTHVKPQGMQCLYNLRQIILAWQMYADDSNGKLASNHGAFPANPDYTAPAGVTYKATWVNGGMRGGSIGAPYAGIDATNTALLVDPNFSSMGPYVKNPSLYRCPSDLSTWMGIPRVRSYSMNQGVGCAFNGTRQDPGHSVLGHWLMGSGGNGSPAPWQTYIKNSDLIGQLAPSGLFVLLDEHPDSINDGAFAVYMPNSPFDTTKWIDVPSNVHTGNSCGFSFADGHVELHRWVVQGGITPPVWAADQSGIYYGSGNAVPEDADMLWLAHHATCPQPGATVGYYPP